MTSITRSLRPVLLSPTAGRPADATMTTFSWSAATLADLRFQVSTDRSFDTLLWDVPVSGLTQLTMEKALPRLGETYFWRVGNAGAWSAPAAFQGTTDENVQQWEWARAEAQARIERDRQRTLQRTVASVADEETPHRSSGTSRLEAALWVYLILVGFGITLALIIIASF